MNNRFNSFLIALIFVLSFEDFITTCIAHSFMLEPTPYNRLYRTQDCSTSTPCKEACPDFFPNEAQNSYFSPAAIWRRGRRVNITWARNNHHGGFISFMLVPIDKSLSTLKNTALHDELAFIHGCWEQGPFICAPETFCGSSTDALSRIIRVPHIYPNGVYIFSIVWYGGLQFQRQYGQFPDYRSCAFVHIKGGAPLVDSYQPFFHAGKTNRKVQGDFCESAQHAPGECPLDGCLGPEFPMFTGKPTIFANGAVPNPITRQRIESIFGYPSQATPSVIPSPTPVSASPTPFPMVSTTSQPAPPGICSPFGSTVICCSTSCGVCLQKNCWTRLGGKRRCCPRTILGINSSCAVRQAPCVLSSGRWCMNEKTSEKTQIVLVVSATYQFSQINRERYHRSVLEPVSMTFEEKTIATGFETSIEGTRQLAGKYKDEDERRCRKARSHCSYSLMFCWCVTSGLGTGRSENVTKKSHVKRLYSKYRSRNEIIIDVCSAGCPHLLGKRSITLSL